MGLLIELVLMAEERRAKRTEERHRSSKSEGIRPILESQDSGANESAVIGVEEMVEDVEGLRAARIEGNQSLKD